jgi:hypothetical protein
VRAEWQQRPKMPARLHQTTATSRGSRWQSRPLAGVGAISGAPGKLARSSRRKTGPGKGVASCLVASVARAIGDGGREAYTAIERGGLLSREKPIAEAETVAKVEGNMSSPAMRGAAALPWSKTPSRSKGSRRNLGDLASDRRDETAARIGKARSRSQ